MKWKAAVVASAIAVLGFGLYLSRLAAAEVSCGPGPACSQERLGNVGDQQSRGISSGGCPDCAAIMIVGDTQNYANLGPSGSGGANPEAAEHFKLLFRWACKYKDGWTETRTGYTMPIIMVVGLGDIVDVQSEADQWTLADAAYDNLDACLLPYIAIVGNHDVSGNANYATPAINFDADFGPARYSAYACATPTACDTDAGEWFVGAGDDITTNMRNNEDGVNGPDCSSGGCDGRHRIALVRGPSGHRFLFLGLDIAFDWSTRVVGNRDDTAFPISILDAYSGIHTFVFSHMSIKGDGALGAECHGGDDCVNADTYTDGMGHAIWNILVLPYPEIVAVFGGHFTGTSGGFTARGFNTAGDIVQRWMRNYQSTTSYGDSSVVGQKDGWIDMFVLDPMNDELRMRSYRIDDEDGDDTYNGEPQDPTLLDVDFNSGSLPVNVETIIPFEFNDTRPASDDNCSTVYNPDQRTAC